MTPIARGHVKAAAAVSAPEARVLARSSARPSTWRWAAQVLVAFVMTTAWASADATPSSMADLKALAASHAWAELLQRGIHVPPSARTAEWPGLITQAANGILATPAVSEDPPRAVEFSDAAVLRYPHLKGEVSFMKVRDDLGLVAFDRCFADNSQAVDCNQRFKAFVADDPHNESFAFAAGQLVSRHFTAQFVAMPYFYWALKGGTQSTKCADARVKAALASAFERAPNEPEVKMAQELTFGPCWPLFATDSELVKDITVSDEQLKNSCAGLLAKKALSGVRLAKCQKVSP